MATRVKRTYNLSPAVVALAKRLVEQRAAPSQDAVVEQAITEFARRLQDAAEAEQWALARADPDLQAELEDLDRLFAADDAEAWR